MSIVAAALAGIAGAQLLAGEFILFKLLSIQLGTSILAQVAAISSAVVAISLGGLFWQTRGLATGMRSERILLFAGIATAMSGFTLYLVDTEAIPLGALWVGVIGLLIQFSMVVGIIPSLLRDLVGKPSHLYASNAVGGGSRFNFDVLFFDSSNGTSRFACFYRSFFHSSSSCFTPRNQNG